MLEVAGSDYSILAMVTSRRFVHAITMTVLHLFDPLSGVRL